MLFVQYFVWLQYQLPKKAHDGCTLATDAAGPLNKAKMDSLETWLGDCGGAKSPPSSVAKSSFGLGAETGTGAAMASRPKLNSYL